MTETPEWSLLEAEGEEKIIAAGRWLGVEGTIWGFATVLGVNPGKCPAVANEVVRAGTSQ